MIKGLNVRHYRDQNTGSYFLMDPQKFTLWVMLVSIVMMFAAFTSAYIVRKAEGNWLEFDLPTAMQTSTLIVLLSSAVMVLAQVFGKQGKMGLARLALGLSLLMGMVFLWSQLEAWKALNEAKVFFVGNPAGSFVYVISGLHGLHIIGGLIFLAIVLSKPSVKWIGLSATYWHFVGLLWVYLYSFLILA